MVQVPAGTARASTESGCWNYARHIVRATRVHGTENLKTYMYHNRGAILRLQHEGQRVAQALRVGCAHWRAYVLRSSVCWRLYALHIQPELLAHLWRVTVTEHCQAHKASKDRRDPHFAAWFFSSCHVSGVAEKQLLATCRGKNGRSALPTSARAVVTQALTDLHTPALCCGSDYGGRA